MLNLFRNANQVLDQNNTPQAEQLIRLRGVVKQYESTAGIVNALKGLDLHVKRAEFTVITGKSGAGKTTLVNMISGLDHVSAGEIWVDGVAVHRLSQSEAARWRRRTLGIVFQSFQLMPGLSVLHNVMLPMDFAQAYTLRQRKERALHLLEQVDILEHAYKLPSAVSGGQQQRVAIARALANDPQLIIADEPTGSLDSLTKLAVFAVFEELARSGKTVIMVTHDKDLASRAECHLRTHLVTLSDGEIIADTYRDNQKVEKC